MCQCKLLSNIAIKVTVINQLKFKKDCTVILSQIKLGQMENGFTLDDSWHMLRVWSSLKAENDAEWNKALAANGYSHHEVELWTVYSEVPHMPRSVFLGEFVDS